MVSSRFLCGMANGRWAPRLRCQLLRDAAVCQKMGPVSGAHPVLARLTPRRTSRDPNPRGVSPLSCRGVSSLYCAYKKGARKMDSGKFTLSGSEARSLFYLYKHTSL